MAIVNAVKKDEQDRITDALKAWSHLILCVTQYSAVPRTQNTSPWKGVSISLGKSLLTGTVCLIGRGVVLLRDMKLREMTGNIHKQ